MCDVSNCALFVKGFVVIVLVHVHVNMDAWMCVCVAPDGAHCYLCCNLLQTCLPVGEMSVTLCVVDLSTPVALVKAFTHESQGQYSLRLRQTFGWHWCVLLVMVMCL